MMLVFLLPSVFNSLSYMVVELIWLIWGLLLFTKAWKDFLKNSFVPSVSLIWFYAPSTPINLIFVILQTAIYLPFSSYRKLPFYFAFLLLFFCLIFQIIKKVIAAYQYIFSHNNSSRTSSLFFFSFPNFV